MYDSFVQRVQMSEVIATNLVEASVAFNESFNLACIVSSLAVKNVRPGML